MRTTNPKDYLELIEMFSIGLTNGLINKSEVVKWSDEIIQKDEEPDYFIIELSLCGQKSTNDIVSLISEYIGLKTPDVSGRAILGLLYREYINKGISLKKVVTSIDWIVWHTGIKEEEKSLMYGISEDFDLASDGIYGTVEAVEKEVLRFLSIYRDFNPETFEKWHEIDKAIDAKVHEVLIAVKQEQAEIIKSRARRKWWKIW